MDEELRKALAKDRSEVFESFLDKTLHLRTWDRHFDEPTQQEWREKDEALKQRVLDALWDFGVHAKELGIDEKTIQAETYEILEEVMRDVGGIFH